MDTIYKDSAFTVIWQAISKGNLKFVKRGSPLFRNLMDIEVSDVGETIRQFIPAPGEDEGDEEVSEEDRRIIGGDDTNYNNKGKLLIMLILGLVIVLKRQVEFFNDEVQNVIQNFTRKKVPIVEEITEDENGVEVSSRRLKTLNLKKTPKRKYKKRQKGSSTAVSTSRTSSRDATGNIFADLNLDHFGELTFSAVFDALNTPQSPRTAAAEGESEEEEEEVVEEIPQGRRRSRNLRAVQVDDGVDHNLLPEEEEDRLANHQNYSEGFGDVDPNNDALLQEFLDFGMGGLGGGVDLEMSDIVPDLGPGGAPEGAVEGPEVVPEEVVEEEDKKPDDEELILPPLRQSQGPSKKRGRSRKKVKAKGPSRAKKQVVFDSETQISMSRTTIRFFQDPEKDYADFYEGLKVQMLGSRISRNVGELTGIDFINSAGRGFTGRARVPSELTRMMEGTLQRAALEESRVFKVPAVPKRETRSSRRGTQSSFESLNSPRGGGGGAREEFLFSQSTQSSMFNRARINSVLDMLDSDSEVQGQNPDESGWTSAGEIWRTASRESGIEAVLREDAERRREEAEEVETVVEPPRKKRRMEARIVHILASGRDNLRSSQSQSQSEKYFTDICPLRRTSRFTAAQNFFTLLRMQKESKVELFQTQAFAPILIRKK